MPAGDETAEQSPDAVRPVILARVPSAGDGPASVHAWRVPVDGAGTCWSACGASAEASALEHVDRFTGAPCLICWLWAISATDIGERPVDQEPEGRRAPGVTGVGIPAPGVARGAVTGRARTYAYTADLGEEALVHLADPHGVRAHRADMSVVQAMCGHVGSGLLEHAPDGAIVCDECADVAA